MTVHVPVEVLARLGGEEFGWQVPALREELVTALIRSLPKDLRRNFVPAPDTARAVLAAWRRAASRCWRPCSANCTAAPAFWSPITAFDLDKLPVHLRVTFAVEAPDGTEIARGKDLEALQEQLAGRTRRAVADVVAGQVERTGLQTWPEDLDELPRTVERTVGSHAVRGYPGFVEAGAGVDVRVFATAAERDAAMTAGLRRLLRRSVPSPVKAMEKVLDPRTRLVLGSNPDGSLAALLEDCADAAVDALVSAPVWTKADFAALRGKVEGALPGTARQVLGGWRRCSPCFMRCSWRCLRDHREARPTRWPTSPNNSTACCHPDSSPPPVPPTSLIWRAISPRSPGGWTGFRTLPRRTPNGWPASTPCGMPTAKCCRHFRPPERWRRRCATSVG